MNVKLLKNLLLSSMISAGLYGTASAHSIAGGQLSAANGSIDVFRTTCVSLSATTISNQGLTGINPGPAQGFLFGINLTKGSSVTATVGWTYASNVQGPNEDGTMGGAKTTAQSNNPNNMMPAQQFDTNSNPSVITATATDNVIGAPWINQAEEPTYTGLTVNAPFVNGYLDGYDNNPTSQQTGNGEYIIVISHSGNTQTDYDFIGHCVNPSLGSQLDQVHTGQGTWWQNDDGTGNGDGTQGYPTVYTPTTASYQAIVSSGDYDQVIGDDFYNNSVYPPLSVLSHTITVPGQSGKLEYKQFNTYGE